MRPILLLNTCLLDLANWNIGPFKNYFGKLVRVGKTGPWSRLQSHCVSGHRGVLGNVGRAWTHIDPLRFDDFFDVGQAII